MHPHAVLHRADRDLEAGGRVQPLHRPDAALGARRSEEGKERLNTVLYVLAECCRERGGAHHAVHAAHACPHL